MNASTRFLLLLGALIISPVGAKEPDVPTRMIAGSVSKVGPGGQWFMLDCPASKKYPRVKVTLDKSTRWTGPRNLIHPARVGDRLMIQAAGKAPDYKAVEIRVPDPDAVPHESTTSAGMRK